MDCLCLKLDELSLWKFCPCYTDRITLVETQRLHHPIREMYAALVSDEFEDACMRGGSRITGISELEHPGSL
jgi:hypothetical protein